jgi:hypothetical protein
MRCARKQTSITRPKGQIVVDVLNRMLELGRRDTSASYEAQRPGITTSPADLSNEVGGPRGRCCSMDP